MLYIGVSNSLKRRLQEHYINATTVRSSFAGKYNCYNLLYYEVYTSISVAIAREKELKGCTRVKKLNLIATINPSFQFLDPPN
jgi:putative endonuclease